MSPLLPVLRDETQARAPLRIANHTVEWIFSQQLRAQFDKGQGAFWMRWHPMPRPSFNWMLLNDISACYDFLTETGGKIPFPDESIPIRYVVTASDLPGIFHLGGDLNLFLQLIEAGDQGGLLSYAKTCIELVYRAYHAFSLPITTISLVQGICMGGGFEIALASDLIVAEESATFCFPEITFNLFPGMGAASFVRRRIDRRKAEAMMADGRRYSAKEMADIGLVDRVAANGCGEAEVAKLMQDRKRNPSGLQGIAAANRIVDRLDFTELETIVRLWVDHALRLTERDRKMMRRLVARQNALARGAE